jgi:hypothetical protein
MPYRTASRTIHLAIIHDKCSAKAHERVRLKAQQNRANHHRSAWGHQRLFKRKSRTSAFPPIPDISLRRPAWRAISLTRDEARRIAANIAKLPQPPAPPIKARPTFGVRPQSTVRDQAVG